MVGRDGHRIARQLTRPAAGVSRRAISFVMAMAPMARPSFGASRRRVYGIARFPLDPLAKWTHGEADRIDPAGLPRSRRDLWRAASPLAQIAEEGRADSARRPRARLANLGWASPSVRSGLNIR